MKRAFSSLLFFPVASWALGLGGTISFEGGFRWDHYDQSGSLPADATTRVRNKVKHIHLGTFTTEARLTYDDAGYFRLKGGYGSVVTRPQREVTVGATTSPSYVDTREFAYDLATALGYTFDLFAGDFLIAPEFGYGYSRLKIDETDNLSYGAPFFGLELRWNIVEVWKMRLHFDYHFLGTRREQLPPPTAGLTTEDALSLRDGHVQGPEGLLYFGYDFNKQWTLGVQYRLKYLFSDKQVINGTSTTWKEKTSWTTNVISLNLGYIF